MVDMSERKNVLSPASKIECGSVQKKPMKGKQADIAMQKALMFQNLIIRVRVGQRSIGMQLMSFKCKEKKGGPNHPFEG